MKKRKTTEYVVWYWDPRGAYREFNQYKTMSAAEETVRGLDIWYIEERIRCVLKKSKKQPEGVR
jgi:hypothetical protein